MNKTQIKLIQRKLSDMGLYAGAIDGLRGPKTDKAIASGMAKFGSLPPNFFAWATKRKAIAFLQAYAADEGIEAGPIDGLWGPQTDYAAGPLVEKSDEGSVSPFLDRPATISSPFPSESRSQSELEAFFGPAGTADGRNRPPLVQVTVPWRLKIAWDTKSVRKALWVHEKAAESLSRVLERVEAAYTDAQKSELGIDLFGGDYAPRQMRGASRSSLHSWGIAFDFDPARNRLKQNRAQARLGQRDAEPFWAAWEAEGWCSLGRTRNYDFMHVQAAVRAY